MKYLINIAIVGILFLGCGEDRADIKVAEALKKQGVLGVVEVTDNDRDGDGLSNDDEAIYGTDPDHPDSDGDGLSDGLEVNTYHTNPLEEDSDSDGLTDREELITYETNATSADTDNDGLKDGEEIKRYETNATSPDTDGDCLLDSFEVLDYNTSATNVDTDGDRVNDGIEIYSTDPSELNVSCLTVPETLANGAEANPAKDGIPDAAHDVINALDPTNDSDGDGQANSKENNCSEGDPLDKDKMCPFATENSIGETLLAYGYAYVPGGFDVDGDGVNEGGFWMSRYQARKSGVEITSGEIINIVGNVNQYISKNFKVLNRNVQVLNYNESPLTESQATAGEELLFKESDVAGKNRISDYSPLLAEACLSRYRLTDTNGTDLDINITMPTNKQYVQVKMLLDADKAHGGDGRHIRNGLLGSDENVPLVTYSLVIDEFGESYKEFVQNIAQVRDSITGEDTFTFAADVPTWWEANATKFKEFDSGATSSIDIGQGTGPESDAYAVVVRGGEILDVRISVTGTESDRSGTTDGISFRAATPYLY